MPRPPIDASIVIQEIFGKPGVCKGCNADIWWCYTKHRKPIPMNGDGSSHFGTCPQANEFRKSKARHP